MDDEGAKTQKSLLPLGDGNCVFLVGLPRPLGCVAFRSPRRGRHSNSHGCEPVGKGVNEFELSPRRVATQRCRRGSARFSAGPRGGSAVLEARMLLKIPLILLIPSKESLRPWVLPTKRAEAQGMEGEGEFRQDNGMDEIGRRVLDGITGCR